MRIKDISVENYRNLNSATITFDESCNFIVGENNLGKIKYIKPVKYHFHTKRICL